MSSLGSRARAKGEVAARATSSEASQAIEVNGRTYTYKQMVALRDKAVARADELHALGVGYPTSADNLTITGLSLLLQRYASDGSDGMRSVLARHINDVTAYLRTTKDTVRASRR